MAFWQIKRHLRKGILTKRAQAIILSGGTNLLCFKRDARSKARKISVNKPLNIVITSW